MRENQFGVYGNVMTKVSTLENNPRGIAVSKDIKWMYVAVKTSPPKIIQIDMDDMDVTTDVNITETLSFSYKYSGLFLSPDDTYLYICDDNALYRVDLSNPSISDKLETPGNDKFSAALSQDGKYLIRVARDEYFCNRCEGTNFLGWTTKIKLFVVDTSDWSSFYSEQECKGSGSSLCNAVDNVEGVAISSTHVYFADDFHLYAVSLNGILQNNDWDSGSFTQIKNSVFVKSMIIHGDTLYLDKKNVFNGVLFKLDVSSVSTATTSAMTLIAGDGSQFNEDADGVGINAGMYGIEQIVASQIGLFLVVMEDRKKLKFVSLGPYLHFYNSSFCALCPPHRSTRYLSPSLHRDWEHRGLHLRPGFEEEIVEKPVLQINPWGPKTETIVWGKPGESGALMTLTRQTSDSALPPVFLSGMD